MIDKSRLRISCGVWLCPLPNQSPYLKLTTINHSDQVRQRHRVGWLVAVYGNTVPAFMFSHQIYPNNCLCLITSKSWQRDIMLPTHEWSSLSKCNNLCSTIWRWWWCWGDIFWEVIPRKQISYWWFPITSMLLRNTFLVEYWKEHWSQEIRVKEAKSDLLCSFNSFSPM